jgi:hypothetical protein
LFRLWSGLLLGNLVIYPRFYDLRQDVL